VSGSIWEPALMLAVLITLLGGSIACWIQRLRDSRAAREASKRDRLHRIATIGFRSAFMRGLVDERGNVIERVGSREDCQ
jgi:hypothetical protein